MYVYYNLNDCLRENMYERQRWNTRITAKSWVVGSGSAQDVENLAYFMLSAACVI